MSTISCPSCGGEKVTRLNDYLYRCDYCGHTFNIESQQVPQQQFASQSSNEMVAEDKPSKLLIVFSFLVPLVGIIGWLMNMGKHPKSAKTYLKWGLISIVLGFLLQTCVEIIAE